MTEGIDEAELLAVPSENGLRLIAFVAGDDVPDTRTMIRKLHEKLEIWEILTASSASNPFPKDRRERQIKMRF